MLFALTFAIVSSTFLKVVLHAQWRGNGARSPVLGVSFWELFLCAYAVKEKVGNRRFDSKTALSLFLLKQEAQKKKLCKKKMPFFALTPRRRPLLKKRSKTTALVCANNVRLNPNLYSSIKKENKHSSKSVRLLIELTEE